MFDYAFPPASGVSTANTSFVTWRDIATRVILNATFDMKMSCVCHSIGPHGYYKPMFLDGNWYKTSIPYVAPNAGLISQNGLADWLRASRTMIQWLAENCTDKVLRICQLQAIIWPWVLPLKNKISQFTSAVGDILRGVPEGGTLIVSHSCWLEGSKTIKPEIIRKGIAWDVQDNIILSPYGPLTIPKHCINMGNDWRLHKGTMYDQVMDVPRRSIRLAVDRNNSGEDFRFYKESHNFLRRLLGPLAASRERNSCSSSSIARSPVTRSTSAGLNSLVLNASL
jgi:hypothetical protein